MSSRCFDKLSNRMQSDWHFLGHFDRLCDRKKLVRFDRLSDLTVYLSATEPFIYFLTENAQMMASEKVSPGRSTVVG